MKVLVIGSGGREHALCRRISESPILTKLWCAPGNPGITEVAECVPMNLSNKRDVVNFANSHGVDIVVVGPEGPLVDGLADDLAVFGIPCCGPSKDAAKLEGSKTFTKELCQEADIPTAAWQSFDDMNDAFNYVVAVDRQFPIVIKADGLAAGKGVVIAQTFQEALSVITEFMQAQIHGNAGQTIVIEECLQGIEASLFALCHGTEAIFLGTAQDHKRVGDGDTGLNTGGMGAISPAPAMTIDLERQAWQNIIQPALATMAKRGTPFVGILFAGLMITDEGPKLIEFNVRFGDPECQAILPRLNSDILAALLRVASGDCNLSLDWSDEVSVAVVMAAPGYPTAPQTGSEIKGPEHIIDGVLHAGTAIIDGKLVAAGGRVLTVCGLGETVEMARDAAYNVVRQINWPEGLYRTDIGVQQKPRHS